MLDEIRSAARRMGTQQTLRSLLQDCRRLLSERGVANSVAIAQSLVRRYESLPPDDRKAFFDRLAEDFSPDPVTVLDSATAYARDPTAENLILLSQAAEPPRQELLRRINRAAGGTAAIVHMRRALLERLPRHPQLRAVEADMLHLLSSWFSPGFLQLRRVDWNAPAQLLEQVIRHEAVHEIDGWDDLRRRLMPDRRCFAFFHPQLPEEPLIFVEVALLPEMPEAIAPLIDKSADPLPASSYKVAAFYSISNCQPGLKGVSLGNFLIKRVADELQRELPKLRTFCTLSPIPGLAAWLARGPDLESLTGLRRGPLERALEARALLRRHVEDDWSKLSQAEVVQGLPEAATQALLRLGAVYLVHQTPTPQGDPVARFHLDNGARLERLNLHGNPGKRGLKQSCGLMVNYLYDLQKVEPHHEAFVEGHIVYARAVSTLM